MLPKRARAGTSAGASWSNEPPDTLEAYSLGRGLEEFVLLSHRLEVHALPDGLTEAERAVARGILDGLSNEEIARRRKVRLRTVAKQVASLFRRLRVTSRAELVRRVLAPGAR